MSEAVLLCYCSCPDSASAQTIAAALVGERLAACVNQLPGICSTYRWQGTVTTDHEELLLIKTTAGRRCAENPPAGATPLRIAGADRGASGTRSRRLSGLGSAERQRLTRPSNPYA